MTATTILNPYHVAGPIHNPAFFFGRHDQLRRILESVWQHHQSINVVGEARSGKTSLLFHLLDRDIRASFVPDDVHSIYAYVNPELCPDLPSFYRLALEGVEKEMPGLLDVTDEPVSNALLEAYLHALLPYHLVLMIDNFERMCEAPHFTSAFFDYLKGLAEHTEAYITMVVASRKHIHEMCPSDSLGSDFFGVFGEVRLGSFTPDEFEEFVQGTSAVAGAPIGEMRDTIAKLAGYYPYLVQMACSHVYDVWRRKGGLQPDDMAVIRRKFQHDARVHLEKVWTRHLSDAEKKVLELLARGHQVPPELASPDSDWPDVATEAVLEDLEAKGYLVNGRIASQCFADYILIQVETARSGDLTGSPFLPREQGIRVDPDAGAIFVDGRKLQKQPGPLQYRLLLHLWQHKGAVCKKDDLALVGWNTDNGVTDEALAQQVARLRVLLGQGRRYITTVNRWGYRLVDDPEEGEIALDRISG